MSFTAISPSIGCGHSRVAGLDEGHFVVFRVIRFYVVLDGFHSSPS